MPRYETYRSNAAEAPIMRKWVLRALLVSLALHGGLFVFFNAKKIENFGMSSAAELVPRRFVLQQTKFDPRALEEALTETRIDPTKLPSVKITVPVEKPEPKEIQFTPQTSQIVLPTENPKATPNWDAVDKAAAESAGRADRELGSITTALLEQGPKNKGQRVLKLPNPTRGGDGIGGNEGIPGTQSVSDALGSTGLSDKPVAMPGGALFGHDQVELAPQSLEQLTKLGQLLARYPNATFIISGHTDWTGTEEYNRRLSLRRAEAVKEWLVENAGVAPERIQTLGKATDNAIVPDDRSVDEQQPNRRVEIVIKTRGR